MRDHQVPARFKDIPAARSIRGWGGRAGSSMAPISTGSPRRSPRFHRSARRISGAVSGLPAPTPEGSGRMPLRSIVVLSGAFRPALAQGVVFATAARQEAGTMATHTALACRIICQTTVEHATKIAETERANLPYDGPSPRTRSGDRVSAPISCFLPMDDPQSQRLLRCQECIAMKNSSRFVQHNGRRVVALAAMAGCIWPRVCRSFRSPSSRSSPPPISSVDMRCRRCRDIRPRACARSIQAFIISAPGSPRWARRSR